MMSTAIILTTFGQFNSLAPFAITHDGFQEIYLKTTASKTNLKLFSGLSLFPKESHLYLA